jgi:hypothetical protein
MLSIPAQSCATAPHWADRSSELLYFSLVTLSTIGYVLYIAITVAIRVGAYRTRNHGG